MDEDLFSAADTAASVRAVANASKATAAASVMGSIAPDSIVAALSGIRSVGALRTVCIGFRGKGDHGAGDEDHSAQQKKADGEFVHAIASVPFFPIVLKIADDSRPCK
jgi:hypothetical protein